VGLEETRPRLSWWLDDVRPAELQTAYHLQAAATLEGLKSGRADRWDSGYVTSTRTVDVVWGGTPLRSRERIWWRVRAYDSDGLPSPWSEPACFEMGLLSPSDWRASWIASPLAGSPMTPVPVPLLWRDFHLDAAPSWARLYVSVLGAARIHVNGVPVGEAEPVGPWVDLNRQAPYRVHDVARLLTPGRNRIAVLLADGDYCGHSAGGARQRQGLRPALCAQLEVRARSADGETAADAASHGVVSDGQWLWRPSWVLRADRDRGEEIDGRQLVPDWGMPAEDEPGGPVAAAQAPLRRFWAGWPDARLLAEHAPSTPLPAATELRPGQPLRVDFSRLVLGRVRVRLRAPAGTVVEVRYGNAETASGADHYTARGQGSEWFEPGFSLHAFRWVTLSAGESGCTVDAVLAREIGLDVAVNGRIDCDQPELQRWFDDATALYRMGLALGPVSGLAAPLRRAEAADLHALVSGAAGTVDAHTLFARWLRASAVETLPGIGLPATALPQPLDATVPGLWHLYRCAGDRRLLERALPRVRRELETFSPTRATALADELCEQAWFLYRCMLAARMAGVLGRQRELERFEELGEAARLAFRARYVTARGLLAADDALGYLLALVLGVLEGEERAAAVERLAGQLAAAGYVPRLHPRHHGLLLEVLTLEGRADLACRVLLTAPPPETLAAGCVAGWLQRFVLGLDLDPDLSVEHNAYRRVLVQPRLLPTLPDVAPLRRMTGHLDTVHGRYTVAWQLADGQFRLSVIVPANCQARARLPDGAESMLGPGEHHLAVAWPPSAEADVEIQAALPRDGVRAG
jgi:alpha-L-rhamnosidase